MHKGNMTEFDEIKQLSRDVLNLHWENKTYKLYMRIEGNISLKQKNAKEMITIHLQWLRMEEIKMD